VGKSQREENSKKRREKPDVKLGKMTTACVAERRAEPCASTQKKKRVRGVDKGKRAATTDVGSFHPIRGAKQLEKKEAEKSSEIFSDAAAENIILKQVKKRGKKVESKKERTEGIGYFAETTGWPTYGREFLTRKIGWGQNDDKKRKRSSLAAMAGTLTYLREKSFS